MPQMREDFLHWAAARRVLPEKGLASTDKGKITLKFFIDDEEKLNAENSGAVSLATSFENVKVYASDPWFPVQPGSIKNLSIKIKR